VPKEIHAILTETLACFLPGGANDLSASLYITMHGPMKIKRGDITVQGKVGSILTLGPTD